MNNKSSKTYLIIIIFLLVICSATSIGYIIGNYPSKHSNNAVLVPSDNQGISNLQSEFNSDIEAKKASYRDLEIEKDKVQELLMELENSKGDVNSLLKYKEQYKNLEDKMRFLVHEIQVLQGNKTSKKASFTESKKVINTKKILESNEPQISKNEAVVTIKSEIIPEKKVDKIDPELKVSNLETQAYRKKSSTISEITSQAKKTDLIKISFSVTGNPKASSFEKKYYIQVINSKNNVLGSKFTEYMDGKTLTYSTMKLVQFEGKNIQVEYDIIADKFEQGNYFISIYDRSELVAKTKFNLD